MEILGAFFPLDPLTLYFMGVGRSAPLFLKARVKHILQNAHMFRRIVNNKQNILYQ